MAGTKHDTGKSRMDLIDMETLMQMGHVLRAGAEVHGEHNWRQGLHVSRNVGAAMRHIAKFLNGEDIDPDHGTPHLIHAMVDLMFAYATVRDSDQKWDDRYSAKDSIEYAGDKKLIYSDFAYGQFEQAKTVLLEAAKDHGLAPSELGYLDFVFSRDREFVTLEVYA